MAGKNDISTALNLSKNKSYTKKQKVEALLILKGNNFDVTKTARQIGVSKKTLSNWRDLYGDEVYDGLDGLLREGQDKAVDNIRKQIADPELRVDIIEAAKRLAATEEDFIQSLSLVRFQALNKISELLSTNDNLRDVVEAAKVLNELRGGGGIAETGFASRERTFMDMVKEQYASMNGSVKYKSLDIETIKDVEYTPQEDTPWNHNGNNSH
jgi:transposase-like protein